MRNAIDVMLFAAGFGTRMRPLTDSRPKPLISVAGHPLLQHAYDIAKAATNGSVIVNAHYLADQVISYVSDKNVVVSLEESRILDTGGGLKAALPLISGNVVATLNTDAVWTGANPLQTLFGGWDSHAMDALLLCIPQDRTLGRTGAGDFSMSPEGRMSRGGDLVYTGAQIIRTDILHNWPEDVFSLNAVWNDLMNQGRLSGVVHRGGWCDVGHPGGIEQAEAMLREANDV